MANPNHSSSTSPGYETQDAHPGGVFTFLVILGGVIVLSALVCWGMFRYFSVHELNQPATDSPFANTRQLPLGPQLQVNPREDWLKFRDEQEKSLDTYEWVNRSTGIVRVPIEQAMDLLVKKGLPVQGQPSAPAADAKNSASKEEKPKP